MLFRSGGQKRFDFRGNETGLQSAYVSADIGVFTGDEAGVDVRARANANYAVSDQVSVSATASYDGEKFLSGAGRSDFAGVFDQRVGARMATSGAAYWRSAEPWGVLNHAAFGGRASWDHQGGDTDATSTTVSASFNTQIGEVGPSVSAVMTRGNEDRAGVETETANLRVRALQRFDWGTATAS